MTSWIWKWTIMNEMPSHMSTITTTRPVTYAILPLSKSLMPCILIHMLKVPAKESWACVLPIKDILKRQIRHAITTKSQNTFTTAPKVQKKDHDSARRLPIPARMTFHFPWYLGPWQQWRDLFITQNFVQNTPSKYYHNTAYGSHSIFTTVWILIT